MGVFSNFLDMENAFAFHKQTLGILKDELSRSPGISVSDARGDSQTPNLLIQTASRVLTIVVAPHQEFTFEINVLSEVSLDDAAVGRLQLIPQDSESCAFSRITHANDVLKRINDILKLEAVTI